jgi:hypothetical protein
MFLKVYYILYVQPVAYSQTRTSETRASESRSPETRYRASQGDSACREPSLVAQEGTNPASLETQGRTSLTHSVQPGYLCAYQLQPRGSD